MSLSADNYIHSVSYKNKLAKLGFQYGRGAQSQRTYAGNWVEPETLVDLLAVHRLEVAALNGKVVT